MHLDHHIPTHIPILLRLEQLETILIILRLHSIYQITLPRILLLRIPAHIAEIMLGIITTQARTRNLKIMIMTITLMVVATAPGNCLIINIWQTVVHQLSETGRVEEKMANVSNYPGGLLAKDVWKA